MAHTKHILAYVLILAVIVLTGIMIVGMMTPTATETLRSESIESTAQAATTLSVADVTRLQTRIEQLRESLKNETNDPERALQIRTEIQSLEQKLAGDN